MYLGDYMGYILAMLFCLAISGAASAKVKSAYAKYQTVRNRSCLTGFDTATRLLRANGVSGIGVGVVAGSLTDHYHPTKNMVNLSEDSAGSASVAACAVAAHEIGHVMQGQEGYFMYRLRAGLVPVVNIGSRLAMPLVFIGIIMDSMLRYSSPELGFKIAMLGVLLYGSTLLFSIVTLPVELDASRRAKRMLLQCGILTEDEMEGASQVLSAAAFTYLASLLSSAVMFLRFLLYVLRIFGRRRD